MSFLQCNQSHVYRQCSNIYYYITKNKPVIFLSIRLIFGAKRYRFNKIEKTCLLSNRNCNGSFIYINENNLICVNVCSCVRFLAIYSRRRSIILEIRNAHLIIQIIKSDDNIPIDICILHTQFLDQFGKALRRLLKSLTKFNEYKTICSMKRFLYLRASRKSGCNIVFTIYLFN